MAGRRNRRFGVVGLLVLLAAAAARAAATPGLEQAQKTVERVRGRSFRRSVPAEEIDPARLRADLAKKFDEGLATGSENYFRSLSALGAISPGDLADLKNRLLDFYGSQVLAFYDPAAGKFFISRSGRERLSEFGESEEGLLLTHELTHALQDQYLALDRRMRELRDDGDAALALQSLLEGEATEVMIEGAVGEIPGAEDGVEAALAPLLTAGLADLDPEAKNVPEFFTQQLFFPYSEGTAYVRAWKKRGGWKAIDGLWKDPPVSTAEILHPGSKIVGAPHLLPARLPAPPGAAPVYTDTLGEWTLRFLLRRGAAPDPDKLAAAWRGDRFAFFQKGDQISYVGRIRTSDGASAAAIARAWEKTSPGSHGQARGNDVVVFTGYEKAPV
ncbi:MAG: hypothetical protein ACRD16_06720 [Thermoanaerobaculia bacterium]